jgi:hypothetical protein
MLLLLLVGICLRASAGGSVYQRMYDVLLYDRLYTALTSVVKGMLERNACNASGLLKAHIKTSQSPSICYTESLPHDLQVVHCAYIS